MASSDLLARAGRPRLAAKARLRYDRKAEQYLLLFPEAGLVLNDTGTDIVRLCTGAFAVADLITQLANRYEQQPAAITAQVLTFLGALDQRGLLVWE